MVEPVWTAVDDYLDSLHPVDEVLEQVQERASAAGLPDIGIAAPDGFDFVFIDADKAAYPDYWRWAVRLAHSGTLIVADNVVRGGAIADPANHEARVEGAREYLHLSAAEPTVLASTVQTVGTKGYDGFSISIVL